MLFVLENVLKKCIRAGNLTIIDPRGEPHRFGDGRGKPVQIRIHDNMLPPLLVFRPDPALGEAYTDGRLTMERGTIYDLLELVVPHFDFGRGYALRTGAALNRLFHALGT